MAISVDPSTHVIYVPKADITLTQPSPEVRTLNLNTFRMWLKDWEDSEEGMPQLKTHNHNTEVTLSGLTYARVIEILSPYTIEFEDGQYTINCTGANHNLADKKVANQVSLIINNAAGLISNSAIEYSSFNGGITMDVGNITGYAVSGTLFPAGTPQAPSDNFADGLIMAATKGFDLFYIIGDTTVDNANDFDNFQFIGASQEKTEITVDSDASAIGCEFYDATVTGVLDGQCLLKNCKVETLNYVNGTVEQCVLGSGTITLGGGAAAHFLDCWSGVVGTGTPTIDMGGSGQELGLRNYYGGLTITNKTGTDSISMDLSSARVVLDDTVTNGTIVVRGIGDLVDSDGDCIGTGSWNGCTIVNGTINRHVHEIHTLQGLDASNPMTVTRTSRVAGGISQVISGDGETTTTVTRQ